MRSKLFIMPVLGLASALALLGDENLKLPASVTTVKRVDFAQGGVVRVNDSRGDLYVDGWDQPVVELQVHKFMPWDYAPKDPERSTQKLNAVEVTAGQEKSAGVEIATTAPKTLEVWWPPSWGPNRNPVRLEYHLQVPRTANVEVRHGVGFVSISGVTGDIRATCHRGDIVVWLPDSGTYVVDAKNKFGKVSSDFPGRSRARFLIGQRFDSEKGSQHLYLRMGFGGITLKPILPESEPGTLH